MVDEELKKLLQTIDEKFKEIRPLLEKAGEELVEKAKREKGVDLEYSIGWQEAGMNCLCLRSGKKNFKTFTEAYDWEEESIEPLFKDLKHLYYESPFGIYEEVNWDEIKKENKK